MTKVSSIAIELNVPRDDFSMIAIKLTFVTLGHGFKKAGSVLFDICAPGTRTFLSQITYITRYLHNWMVLRLCIVFTIGDSSRVCSQYIVNGITHFLFEALLQDVKCKFFRILLVRSRSNYFAHDGQHALLSLSDGYE